MKKIIAYILLIIIIFSAIGLATSYATTYTPPKIPKPHSLVGPETNSRNVLVENILPNFAVGIIGLVTAAAFLFLIIAGVRFATVYGNEEAAQTAKKQVIFALAGLLVALLAYTIVNIISTLEFEGDTTSQPTLEGTPDAQKVDAAPEAEAEPSPTNNDKADPTTPDDTDQDPSGNV